MSHDGGGPESEASTDRQMIVSVGDPSFFLTFGIYDYMLLPLKWPLSPSIQLSLFSLSFPDQPQLPKVTVHVKFSGDSTPSFDVKKMYKLNYIQLQ